MLFAYVVVYLAADSTDSPNPLLCLEKTEHYLPILFLCVLGTVASALDSVVGDSCRCPTDQREL